MTSFQICVVVIFLIVTFISTILTRRLIRFITIIKNSESCFKTIDRILETAFNTIYKEQVMAFSSEGVRPDSKSYETIQRNFIKLVLILMGPAIEKELTIFFGNRQTLIQYINTFFQNQLDNDEILKFVESKTPKEGD